MSSKKCRVQWWERARAKVRLGEVFINQLSEELKIVFANQGFREITVYDVFLGYNQDERRRIVLAVLASSAVAKGQAKHAAPPQSNLVKIGLRAEVERDHKGWYQTLAEKGHVSRLLSPVRHVVVAQSDDPKKQRSAVVYQDAYRLYGAESHDNAARPLEEAVERAIQTNVPECKSFERLLAELYSDMFRCCYRSASDQDTQPVSAFYQKELKNPSKVRDGQSAWDRWQHDPDLQLLRRDALWLTTAQRSPTSTDMPLYLDPVDYFQAVLIDTNTPQVPATLVGPGHGDLHGRNVVVGILRNEVFQPSVFDYGDMSVTNLPVWDFVKLEMELKCRLVSELCDSAEARSALRHYLSRHVKDMLNVSSHFKEADPLVTAADVGSLPSVNDIAQQDPVSDTLGLPAPTFEQVASAKRSEHFEMAVLFDQALALMTHQIDGKASAERRIADSDRSPTRHPIVDRALCLFFSLRKEAACWLGNERDRLDQWRDEYYFALAAYGLLTAKWRVDGPHQAWALISAGVAVTQLKSVKDPKFGLVASLKNPDVSPTRPREISHLIPLALGTRLSELEPPQYEQSAAVLTSAIKQFPNAVSLKTELSLALANSNRPAEAQDLLQDLQLVCGTFRDHELLCRVARAYKEMGDTLWAADNPRLSFADFVKTKHSGYQRYGQALACYAEAFEFSGHYYPAINAATMALLHGEIAKSKVYAELTREICGPLRPNESEQLWVFATEGEACLILGELDEAKSFYQSAFKLPQCRVPKTVNSIFNQLSRLDWALGEAIVEPIIQAMRDHDFSFSEKASPFYLRDRKTH